MQSLLNRVDNLSLSRQNFYMERNNTVNQLLDVAETLLQTRGYHDFSFRDMATQVGINFQPRAIWLEN